MATGGVDIPVPQKRPTVIRPSKTPDIDDDQSAPVRPVPPVPVRPTAPTIPPRKEDVALVRPQPPVPGGPPPSEPAKLPPPITGRPPPPVPTRVGVVAPKQSANGIAPSHRLPPTSEKPAGRPKARPEITIVSARPMSEVGFRSQGDSSHQTNPTTDTKPKTSSPPRPKSQPLKPTDMPLISFDDDIPSASDGMYTEVQAAAPIKRAPPSVPPAANKPSQSKAPPDRPLPSPRSEATPASAKPTLPEPHTVQRQAAVDEGEVETRPARPANPKLGVPLPAVPRNPAAPSRPPSISPRKADVPPNLTKIKSEQNEEPEISSALDKADDTVTNDTANANGDTAPTYAVINKPKRPTIIRPGRASVKENKEEDNKEAPKIPPKIIPRLSDLEDQPASDNVNKTNSDDTPEFLRLKLKNTVNENSVRNDSDKSTAGSGATDKGEEVIPSAGLPSVTPKPKPTVLPKPKVAAKPNISAKPAVSKPVVPKPVLTKPVVETPKDNNANTTEQKMPIDSETDKESPVDNNNVEKSKGKIESALFKRPGSVKRPTIIRPTKPAWGSTDNVRQPEPARDPDPASMAESADDSVVRRRPQPPLPTKRPVSMSNIPQMLAQESLSLRSTSSHSVKSGFSSSENVNTDDQQLKPPPPHPVARARPMSMAAGDSTKTSPPSLPQRSPRLPPGAQGLPGMSAGDRVPAEPHRPPPPKPGRGPTSSEQPGSKSSSSEDDDEFVMAQTKPDRPQGPPRPAQRQSQREPEPEVKKSPPGRPGGPPTPRKMSSPEAPEHQPGLEGVKMRPARPGSKPTRPMSMPVKAVLPSRPQLPKAGSSRSKGLPALPPRPGPGHPAYHHMMCVPHGQALHDYTARQGDELSFKKGDIVLLERAIDAEWLVGKVDENEGMFPRGFIKVLMPLPGEALAEEESSDENEEFFDASPEKPDTIGHGPRCRARFDFDGEGHDDLAFEEGDVIRLLERAGTEWRRGEINGRTGLFPLAYVEIIEDLGPEEGGDEGNSLVTALFDFEGEEGELNFTAGEKIQVTHCVNEEWLYGEIGARKGQFPVQFIDHVPQDLPPLPKQAKAELSPSQAVDLGASSKDVIGISLSQWDTADSENTEQTHSSKEDNHASETPYCTATYDFPGQTEDDLSFSIGDRIEIVERIDADWLKGKLNGHVGMFPAGFVDVKIDVTDHSPSPPSPHNDDQPQGVETVALYDFQGVADNELTFCAGDQLIVQELVEGAGDWRWGVHGGRRGIFPAAFVSVS